MMQWKGVTPDVAVGPATVSSPRTVARRSPSPSPVRKSRSPVKTSRSPGRYSFESSSASCSQSRSPLRPSSHSSVSPDRAGSSLDFLTTNQPEDAGKTTRFSDGVDDDSSVKVSSAQYQLFKQAVMSKGSFKIVPARSKQAARASLLDLGEDERTERVAWTDQPSLQDTMASTARIAQMLCSRILGFNRKSSASSVRHPSRDLMCLDRNLKCCSSVSEVSGRRTGWLVPQWHSRRLLRTQFQPRPARRHPQARRTSSPGPQSLNAWGLPLNQHHSRRLSPKILSPFMQAPAGEPGALLPSLSKGRPKKRPLLQRQADVDGLQVGAHLAGFAHQWRSLLGTCRATRTVEEGVGLTFVHRPQLTHHSIAFRTRNSQQDLQQAVDALLSKGAIERVLNESSLGFYSRLFLVPKKTGDLRPVINLSTLNRHFVVPHFKMETQGFRSSRPQEPRMDRLHRHKRWLSPCPDAQGRQKVPAIQGQQEDVPIHLSTLRIVNFTSRIYQASKTSLSLVKAAKCQATCLLGQLADPCGVHQNRPNCIPRWPSLYSSS